MVEWGLSLLPPPWGQSHVTFDLFELSRCDQSLILSDVTDLGWTTAVCFHAAESVSEVLGPENNVFQVGVSVEGCTEWKWKVLPKPWDKWWTVLFRSRCSSIKNCDVIIEVKLAFLVFHIFRFLCFVMSAHLFLISVWHLVHVYYIAPSAPIVYDFCLDFGF